MRNVACSGHESEQSNWSIVKTGLAMAMFVVWLPVFVRLCRWFFEVALS